MVAFRSGQPNHHERSRVLPVGRDREQGVLRSALDAACAGHGCPILIGGEAGIGKTTLVEWIAEHAIERHALVLTGRCYDLGVTPALGPWLELFDECRRTVEVPIMPPALQGEADHNAASQLAWFELARAFLTDIASVRPLLLVLEDLHWADQDSVDLLRVVARKMPSLPILLIVTYRSDERSHAVPLKEHLPALVREAHAERLELKPLDESAIREVVRARYRFSTGDEVRIARYLQQRTEGNPLFISELLRTLEDEGFVRAGDPATVGDDLDQVPVPTLIREVIEGRAKRLNAEVQRLLGWAAVIGDDVATDVLSLVAEVDEERLLTAIEDAISANFMTASPDGSRIRFTHALIRETMYQSVMAPRRRTWHQRIGEVLLTSSQSDPDAIAFHLQQSGDRRAVHWLIEAGERALRRHAWVSAVDRFEAAAVMMAQDRPATRQRGWLLYRIGRLKRYADPQRAVEALDEAERIAADSGDNALSAFARFDHGIPWMHLDRRADQLTAITSGFQALLSIINDPPYPSDIELHWLSDSQIPPGGGPDPSAASDLATAAQSRLGVYALQLAEAARFHEGVAIAEGFLHQEIARSERVGKTAIADALDGLALGYAALGRAEDARREFERSCALAMETGHLLQPTGTLLRGLRAIAIPYFADDIMYRERIAQQVEAMFQRAAELSPFRRVPGTVWRELFLIEGRWDELRRLLAEAQTPASQAQAAILARLEGRPATAWKLISEIFPNGPINDWDDVNLVGYITDVAFLALLAAELALDTDDAPLARVWIESYDCFLDWSGRVPGRSESHVLWTRYYQSLGDDAAAYSRAQDAISEASNPRQPLALLAALRYAGHLMARAGRHADAERHLKEALALAVACKAPYERSLTLLEMADVCASTGQRDAARNLVNEAQALVTPLGASALAMTRVNELTDRLGPATADRHPAGLTSREMDVLRLVARGLTDADIAEQLFVARRTVNTHLTSIYTKLGVSSRAAATRWAVEQGVT